jgi:hypothetical protein
MDPRGKSKRTQTVTSTSFELQPVDPARVTFGLYELCTLSPACGHDIKEMPHRAKTTKV